MYLQYDVLIIGAGAAGMTAAITAASMGASVAVIEKNKNVGRKLAITGKGRCNVTNACDIQEFMKNVPVNSKFLYSCVHGFDSEDVMDFFERLGVPLKTERGNRVFPVSDSAKDVVNALEKEMKRLNVKLIKDTVRSLVISDGCCTGVKTSARTYEAKSVLVASGGKSYPLTGSTGDGYMFAKQAGHHVTDLAPSLVPIEISEKFCKDLNALALKNVTLTLRDNGKVVYSDLGEMSFTYYGVTGPLVLTVSSRIRKIEPGRFTLHIDLKPGLSVSQLDKRIQRDFALFSNAQFSQSLSKLLPSKLIPVIVDLSGIAADTTVNQITREQRTALVSLIKNVTLHPAAFRPIEEAIITSGGVDVKEIDPKTMQSKLVKGLYFAGEVIDVDGYTGGFNLQIAFSSGYAAGMNML